MDLDFEKAILVVGSDQEYKTYAAKALALEPEPVSQTLGGEIYGRSLQDLPGEAASAYNTAPFKMNKKMKFREIVVNTSPFQKEQATDDEEMRRIAPLWISWNRLQELKGKEVAVVCVINTIPPDLSSRTSSRSTDLPTWLGLLRYIFNPAKAPITFLVFMVKRREDGMQRVIVKQNLAKVRFKDLCDVMLQYGALEVGAKLEIPTMRFFKFPEVHNLHGPWAPVKVILFGRTGSGKSTLAQMLTKGKLDPEAKPLATSSGARGKTDQVEVGFNAKWFVVDTPGLGQTRDELNTIDTKTAVMKIFEDIDEKHGIFTHYIYVYKQDRHDLLEEDTWNFFLRLFGEQIANNFTVVITNSTPEWIDKHMERLRTQFNGCNHILSVQFQPVVENDNELEEENQADRLESLRQLEEGLVKLNRNEVIGNYGKFSKMTVDSEVAHFGNLTKAKTNMRDRALAATSERVAQARGSGVTLWQQFRKVVRADKARDNLHGHGMNFDS